MKRLTLFIGILLLQAVWIQPPFNCTGVYAFPVVYPQVDNYGFAPRPIVGTENLFNCVADNDPDFSNRRFPDVPQAQDYWFKLVLQELNIIQHPKPHSFWDDMTNQVELYSRVLGIHLNLTAVSP